jgi:hypothetical protein
MLRTQWNDDEDAALLGLPLLARVLYLQGLRRHMDYATGLVGAKRKVCYQGLREVAFVEPVTGRQDAGSPSIKSVRVAIQQLIKAGLIESKGTDKQLIFYCPMADLDQSDQKKEGRPRADLGQTYQGTSFTNENNGDTEQEGRPRADLGQTYQGNPQESGNQEENPPLSPRAKKPKPKPDQRDLFEMPGWLNRSAWAEFEKHRAEIKKPLTDLAREKAVKQLEGLTLAQQQDCIDNTIQNRWTGLFPTKVNGHAKPALGRSESRTDRSIRTTNELQERLGRHFDNSAALG